MALSQIIEDKLREAFAPETLSVEDESEKHRGHAGYKEGGDSHFRVHIKAASFGPLTRIQRHRAVHEALGTEVMTRLHALALHIES